MAHYLPLSDMRGREFDLHGKSSDSNKVKRRLGDWIPGIDGDGFLLTRGSSSVGRASAFQAEGRGFDPRFPLHCDNGIADLSSNNSAGLSLLIDRFFFAFGPRSSVGGALPW